MSSSPRGIGLEGESGPLDRGAVWRMVPHDIGPEFAPHACRLRLPGFQEIYGAREVRAQVIGYLRQAER